MHLKKTVPIRLYSWPQALVLAFFSPALYRDIYQYWRGIGFGYLFALNLIIGLPAAGVAGWLTYQGMFHVTERGMTPLEEAAYRLAAQIPPMRWDNGRLEVKALQPYRLIEPSSGLQAIIDTTGQTQSLHGTDAFVLLTRDQLVLRKHENTYEVMSFRDMIQPGKWDGDAVFDANMGARIVYAVNLWLKAHTLPILATVCSVVYIAVFLFSFICMMIEALIYGVFGLIFAAVLKVPLTYPTALRLACIAATPGLIFDAASTLAGMPVSGWWIVGLDLGYLAFAVAANRGAEPG